MPTVKVLTRKPANPKGLTLIDQKGWTFRLPTSPSTWDYRDMQRWGQIEREGFKAISRPVGIGLRTLSFSINIFALNTGVSVEDQIIHLTNIAARGTVIRIKGGSGYYQGPCWWYVKDYTFKANRLTPSGRVTQATMSFDLEEYVEGPGNVMKPPPPAPPKKPAPTPVKKPVYRWHTVVKNDWLSKLAIRYLGNMSRWPEIYALNRAVVGPNPNLIYPGQKLKIPPK